MLQSIQDAHDGLGLAQLLALVEARAAVCGTCAGHFPATIHLPAYSRAILDVYALTRVELLRYGLRPSEFVAWKAQAAD